MIDWVRSMRGYGAGRCNLHNPKGRRADNVTQMAAAQAELMRCQAALAFNGISTPGWAVPLTKSMARTTRAGSA